MTSKKNIMNKKCPFMSVYIYDLLYKIISIRVRVVSLTSRCELLIDQLTIFQVV